MPRVNLGKTPEQLAAEAKDRHKEKVKDVIRVQMAVRDVSRHDLAAMTAIDYKRLCRLLCGDTAIDLWTMTLIADALKFSPEQRAAVIGGKMERKTIC